MATWDNEATVLASLPEGWEYESNEAFPDEASAESYVLSLKDEYGENIDSPDGIPSEPYYKKVIRFLTTVGEYVVAVIRYVLSGMPATP